MPTISMFYGIIISMFFEIKENHHLPHVQSSVQKVPQAETVATWRFGNPLFLLTTNHLSLITAECKKDFLHSAPFMPGIKAIKHPYPSMMQHCLLEIYLSSS